MSTDQHTAAATIASTSWLTRVRRFPLWSIRPRALTYLLGLEVLVGALTVVVLLQGHFAAVDAVRAALLVGLSTLFSETANRVDLLRRYLHLGVRDRAWSNPTSVWTFAAALLLPAGYAAVVVAVIYGHILLRSRRHKAARSYRIVVSCTTTLLGTYAAIALQGALGIRLSDGGAEAALVALVALLGYTVVSLVAITTAAYLERRPATVRAVLPGADALGFEVATLLLGVVTAAFVLGSPWLLPAVFVLVAVLHRSTLVNELEGAARTDTKTGLLTADAWHSLADQHLLRAERQGTPVAVLMIDLDHFKMVNDRCGHLAGDRTLKAVSDRLKEELRGYDAVGRFGGEEFIALLDGVATETAMNIAVRITQAIRALTPSPPTTAAHGQSPHPSGWPTTPATAPASMSCPPPRTPRCTPRKPPGVTVSATPRTAPTPPADPRPTPPGDHQPHNAKGVDRTLPSAL